MSNRSSNIFLSGVSKTSYARLMEGSTLVDLNLGRQIMTQGGQVDWVYFPESCLLSLISVDGCGESIETSMSGLEGAAGLLEACGSGQSSVDCVVQVNGKAWRASSAHCRRLAFSDMAFNADAWRLIEFQMSESRQSGLCQATHTVEARAARWLLESLDRSGGRNPLPLTQDFLASMLGVQRTTVSAVAAELQRRGLISYARGRVTIVDAPGLEKLACECRQSTRQQRARLRLSGASNREDPFA